MRNKCNESVTLACYYGIWHLRYIWPYSGQWDDGSEAKDFQKELMFHTGGGSASVKISKSTDNTPIESWWRQLFEGVSWYYRTFFFPICSLIERTRLFFK